jgi:hypothetical protein
VAGLERQLDVEVRDEITFDREVVAGIAHTVYVGIEMSPAGAPLIQRRIERDGYQRTFEHLVYEGAAQIPNAAAILATDGVVSKVSAFGAASQVARLRNLPLVDLFDEGVPAASTLEKWADAQGWERVQSPTGPAKYIDENGVRRLTIKRGSPRTPGSEGPHVEIRNDAGKRIDPWGKRVTGHSAGNHTAIRWDL